MFYDQMAANNLKKISAQTGFYWNEQEGPICLYTYLGNRLHDPLGRRLFPTKH
jgi:hypothetical protein